MKNIQRFKSSYANNVTLHKLKSLKMPRNFGGTKTGMNVRVNGKVVGRVHLTLMDHMPNFPMYDVTMLVGADFKDISYFSSTMQRKKKRLVTFYLTWQNAVETLLLRVNRLNALTKGAK